MSSLQRILPLSSPHNLAVDFSSPFSRRPVGAVNFRDKLSLHRNAVLSFSETQSRHCGADFPLASSGLQRSLRKSAVKSQETVQAVTMDGEVTGTSTGKVDVEAVEIPPLLVFTTEACRFCRAAKSSLSSAGFEFREVNVGVGRPRAAEIRATLAKASGISTVPVVYAAGHLIGGSDDTQKAISSGQLKALLTGPPVPLPQAIVAILQENSQEDLNTGPTESSSEGNTGWGGLSGDGVEGVLAVYRRMADPNTGIRRDDRRTVTGPVSLLFPHVEPRVFSGEAGVTWIVEHSSQLGSDAQGSASDARAAALALLRKMEALGLVHHTECQESFSDSPSLFFRLLSDEAPVSSALNASPFLRPPRPASIVASELRKRTLALYEEGLSLDGRSVDYLKLRDSESFRAYQDTALELQKVDVLSLSRSGQKAFWINVYNSLNIHGLIAKGTPPNLMSRLAFYGDVKYRISSLDFSLNDIEHGVLRGNRPTAPKKHPTFGSKDPRRYFSLPPLDPRIHFALNCGAKSCPPIKLYSEEGLEAELDSAARAFLSEDAEIREDGESGAVVLSKLLQWYGADFGSTNAERLRWMLPYLDNVQREKAEGLLKRVERGAGDVRFQFKPYDWGANESGS